MALSFNRFSNGKKWQDQVLDADVIWAQVKALLESKNIELPKTPRRPDVRLIINNISGQKISFQNPGGHSGGVAEEIPGTGDNTAAMVMVQGATLDEQYKNAEILYKKYDLDTNGLSAAFVADLIAGKLSGLVSEAYGPAPLQGQASKLVDVEWTGQDGTKSNTIVPVKGTNAAYGARAATDEAVFLAQFQIYVKGTGTTTELVESDGMDIGVTSDWQTGAVTIKPIVPSVAKNYYGEFFDNIPVAIIHPNGQVKSIDLKNGTVLTLGDAQKKKSAKKPAPK